MPGWDTRLGDQGGIPGWDGRLGYQGEIPGWDARVGYQAGRPGKFRVLMFSRPLPKVWWDGEHGEERRSVSAAQAQLSQHLNLKEILLRPLSFLFPVLFSFFIIPPGFVGCGGDRAHGGITWCNNMAG